MPSTQLYTVCSALTPAWTPSEEQERQAKVDARNRSRAVDELIRYLTDRRQKYSQALAALLPSSRPSASSARPTASPSELLDLPNDPLTKLEPAQLARVAQVVDTALFRAYLATKPAMVGPLCRIENWCEVAEVEGLLLEARASPRFPRPVNRRSPSVPVCRNTASCSTCTMARTCMSSRSSCSSSAFSPSPRFLLAQSADCPLPSAG